MQMGVVGWAGRRHTGGLRPFDQHIQRRGGPQQGASVGNMLQSFTLGALGRRAAAAALLLCAAGAAQAIVGGTDTSAFGQVDSGVQITDNWVLTARHVGYAVGGTYSNGYGSSTIAARYELGGGVTLQNDLSLLRLDSERLGFLRGGLRALPLGLAKGPGVRGDPDGLLARAELIERLDDADDRAEQADEGRVVARCPRKRLKTNSKSEIT